MTHLGHADHGPSCPAKVLTQECHYIILHGHESTPTLGPKSQFFSATDQMNILRRRDSLIRFIPIAENVVARTFKYLPSFAIKAVCEAILRLAKSQKVLFQSQSLPASSPSLIFSFGFPAYR